MCVDYAKSSQSHQKSPEVHVFWTFLDEKMYEFTLRTREKCDGLKFESCSYQIDRGVKRCQILSGLWNWNNFLKFLFLPTKHQLLVFGLLHKVGQNELQSNFIITQTHIHFEK